MVAGLHHLRASVRLSSVCVSPAKAGDGGTDAHRSVDGRLSRADSLLRAAAPRHHSPRHGDASRHAHRRMGHRGGRCLPLRSPAAVRRQDLRLRLLAPFAPRQGAHRHRRRRGADRRLDSVHAQAGRDPAVPMKHRILFALATVSLLGALVVAQRQHAEAQPGAQSILYLVADSERDLTTLPSHFTRLSDDDEAKYGDELAAEVGGSSEKQRSDDVQIESVVRQVGGRVASQAHRRLRYRFHYLPDRTLVNAFALPCGHVFIGLGLIEHMTTEDELATVLAHEVEHVDHYHCAERLQVEAALRKIPLGEVLAIPVAIFQGGYSKDQELEADREGVLLAHRARYSAAGAIRAFEMLRDLSHEKEERVRTPQGELVSVATGVLTGYFRSHPATEDRIAQVRTMIAQDPSLADHPETELPVEYIFTAARALDVASQGEFRAANDLAQRALREHPGYPAALRGMLGAALGLEQYRAAQEAFRELIARDPATADAAERSAEARANELFALGQYDREIRLIESVLVVQPSQPRLLRSAAWAYAMKGEAAGAQMGRAHVRTPARFLY